MKKIKHFIKERKIVSIVIIVIIILLSYYIYSKYTSKTGQNSYILGKAKVTDIITTISGTGQVFAEKQLDLKSKASGDIVYLNKDINGKQIKKGDLIAQIDTRDALLSLESAKLAYEKLIAPADAPTILQAQNNYNDAIQNNSKSYSDAFNTIVNTFIDLPNIMTGIYDIFYSQNGYLQTESIRSTGQMALDLQAKAGISFDSAKNHYDNLLAQYKNFSASDSTSTIESFTTNTYTLLKEITEVVKNTQNAINYVKSQKNDTAGATAQTNIATWSSTIISDTSNLLSAKNTISNSKLALLQQKASLDKTTLGATELDIASQDLQLQQARNTYNNYFIRAPFDGILARLSVKSTDTVSNGTVIGTIISSEKIATITLNEVDVAKVKIGQKVTLTFDAIDGLTANGTVTVVDSVGTVTQGVVNYNVEISIDSQDERIKSGMSVSASIIIDVKENVLTVPNSAIKTFGKNSFVDVFDPPLNITRGLTGTPSSIAPTQKKIEIGIANDSLTEIISGLTENDQIVTRTITSTTATKTNTSILGGGNAVRIPRGN